MTSPFYLTKRDHESDRLLFWLPQDFLQLEERKPMYVTGSRGTGKTCLLRALSWTDRLQNDSLRKALRRLKSSPFSGKFVGVYFRVSDYISHAFVNWPARPNSTPLELVKEVQGQRFSLWLELIALQLCAQALLTLRARGVLAFSVKDERQTCQDIVDEQPGILDFLTGSDGTVGLLNLHAAFSRMHFRLRECAIERVDPQPPASFPNCQIGGYLKSVAERLVTLMGKGCEDPPRFFKVCFDEAECLTPLQQVAVNTLARLASHPVSVAVAFARKAWDKTTTLLPGLTNSDADLGLWDLDRYYSAPAKRFGAFACAIAELRLQDWACMPSLRFSAERVLGNYGVDDLLLVLITGSTRPELADLVRRSEALRTQLKGVRHQPDDEGDGEEAPPIYLRYILDREGLPELPAKRRATALSARRKYQAAALVHFCREFEFGMIYAGLRVVLHLSSGCIRDFLQQMHWIYDRARLVPEPEVGTPTEPGRHVDRTQNGRTETTPIIRFTEHRVDPRRQSMGVVEASNAKLSSICEWVVTRAQDIEGLIRGLGVLRSIIQSDPARLDAPERGVFWVTLEEDAGSSRLLEILTEAQTAGFIKTTRDGTRMEFVLHQLFSPANGLSYRRPLHRVELSVKELLSLASQSDEMDRRAAAEAIAKRLVREPVEQMKLPFARADGQSDEDNP